MKRNTKGFTLIELLAVIVILAIIALIATPIVLNLINKAREGAAKDSAYGVKKAAELYYADALITDPTSFDEITFTCSKANNGCVNGTKKLSIDGTIPTKGDITIYNDGTITFKNLTINGYILEFDYTAKTFSTVSSES